MIRTCLIGLILGLYTGLASADDIWPDDHGNTVLAATAFSGSSNTVTGVLEYDMDVDVFSFPFKPWTAYTIAVGTGTVWGVSVYILPPLTVSALWTTNSVWTGLASFSNLYHEGAQSRWYIAVSSMFQFTVGSYSLAVWETPGQDTDGDGFPDAWELDTFGDLNTADPALHTQAFQTGRSPSDPLAIEGLQNLASGDVVHWSVAAYGIYDLYTSTNLLRSADWQYLGTHISGNEAGSFTWTNAPSADQTRFYRLQFRNE